jgi:lipopolysaccharide transport system ATP-binding protein
LSEKVRGVFSRKNYGFGEKELFWALKDVSFEVKEGERIGIIGRNGAGKSTLLKILSRITESTSGKISIKGRVASLLEVGTGFHPELSGRENIFLNGSILGMSRSEIKRKFDEIVSFSEVEKFLDTPVKRYSSGMYVRLAFAVAAHLEPEILIVDEVLAVGDAQFQKKCMGKMQDVSKNEGRTILFVSHNLAAVQKLCNYGVLLNKGVIEEAGKIEMVTNKYLNTDNFYDSEVEFTEQGSQLAGSPIQLRIENINNELVHEIPVGNPFQVKVKFRIHRKTENFIIALGLKSISDYPIRTSFSSPTDIQAGDYEAVFKYSDIMLASGVYPLVLGLSSYQKSFFYKENVTSVQISEVTEIGNDPRIIRNSGVGFILNPIDVSIIKY